MIQIDGGGGPVVVVAVGQNEWELYLPNISKWLSCQLSGEINVCDVARTDKAA